MSGVFSPAIQGAFLAVSSDASDALSTAALSLTVTLIDSIFERVVVLLLDKLRRTPGRQPDDAALCDALLREILTPADCARVDAALREDGAKSDAGPFGFSVALLRLRIRTLASDGDNDGDNNSNWSDSSSSVMMAGSSPMRADLETSAISKRRSTVRPDALLSDASVLRIAALLRVVTQQLLRDALAFARSLARSSLPISAASVSVASADVLPQHVQVACEREPMATLMRVVATPMAQSLSVRDERFDVDDGDEHDRDNDGDDDDDDLLLASSIVTASDAVSVASSGGSSVLLHDGGGAAAPNPQLLLLQTRDPWSSNASQASSTTGWMPPLSPPPPLPLDESPLGVARRVWRFVVSEPLGAKHVLCIVILDAVIAALLQQHHHQR
jgi:hypothetical protein